MRYGNLQLHYKPGSLVESPTKVQHIRHYRGSRKSKAIQLGQSSTTISCILVSRDNPGHRAIRQIYHSEQEADLYLFAKGYYYKDVVVSEMQDRSINGDSTSEISIEFTALEPIPFSIVTNESIY